ncbi:hypothetical protein CO054_03190 [Candidatus Shapirobacteria bacterium CG_4_9_14_0_2_um_filter_39_11]|uniref:Uncharacterized protein n=1 Tax=Candidatus Shapirobacteria bacterium CG_4_9_14_0_2_um_filter_39_11 TaxID=1974478 RepID=A0A2M8ERX1_9BACT|nr:MAG: hypothetical protein CO054_03190 [Candidatus Shapirobacteria bacterium CG_4_9_14_0_2_um_filter_39_11]
MLKREVTSHLLVTLVWLGIVTLLRWSWHWNLILLWLGGFVGTFLLDTDHLLYTLIIYPQELTSMRVRRLLELRRFKEALVLLTDTHEERFKSSFHNALFQPILYVVCFFVLTSTGSLFGASLVMAMALHLLKDELEPLLLGREEYLRKWLFWQIKTEVSFYNQKLFVVLMLIVFLGLNLLLI